MNNNSNFTYEIIEDVSEENLIKKLPKFDGCTLRVSKLNENISKTLSQSKSYFKTWSWLRQCRSSIILKKKNITLLITATANASGCC